MKQENREKEIKNMSLTADILDRIEQESVIPYARWRFMCLNCVVWIAWLISVGAGALSFAVLIYVGDHTRFSLYEATHESVLSFAIDVMPYIWIFTFVIMSLFAYYNIRHTKKGYKYPFWAVLGSSIFGSVIGGVVLYIFGVGYSIDTKFSEVMPLYQSLEHTEQNMWQNPHEGRLLGTFKKMGASDSLYTFEDISQSLWSIQTDELRDADKDLLTSGAIVRVLGTTTNATQKTFHACGVFPWMYNRKFSSEDMKKQRKLFIQKMYTHMDTAERLKKLEHVVFDKNEEMPFQESGLCANLAAVKRMKF